MQTHADPRHSQKQSRHLCYLKYHTQTCAGQLQKRAALMQTTSVRCNTSASTTTNSLHYEQRCYSPHGVSFKLSPSASTPFA